MKQRIPRRNRDLRRYVAVRRALQITGFLVWVLAFAMGALLYNAAHQTYPPEKQILGWRLALWMLAALLTGAVVFRLWRLITLRAVEGRILRAGLSHHYTASEDPVLSGSGGYDFRTHSALLVEDESGKRKRLRFEQKNGFYLYYYPGNRVCRFSGLPYPLCDPASSHRPPRQKRFGEESAFDDLSEGCLCVACGMLNRSLELPCARCGLSLIDPREVFGMNENKP